MIILTDEQEIKLRRVLPNMDEILATNSKRELLIALDMALVNMLDKNYNTTPQSREYQRLYDAQTVDKVRGQHLGFCHIEVSKSK